MEPNIKANGNMTNKTAMESRLEWMGLDTWESTETARKRVEAYWYLRTVLITTANSTKISCKVSPCSSEETDAGMKADEKITK